MISSIVRGLAVVSTFFLPGLATAQAKHVMLESAEGLRLRNVFAESAAHQGRKGLRVTATREAAGQADAEKR